MKTVGVRVVFRNCAAKTELFMRDLGDDRRVFFSPFFYI